MTKISEAIKDDHQELEEAYNKILNASTDDEKTRWRNQFTWELARHSIGEELVLYPAFEQHLSSGKEKADKDRQEHLKVRPHCDPIDAAKTHGTTPYRSRSIYISSRTWIPKTRISSPR
jgi:hemerythrin superfamily protein